MLEGIWSQVQTRTVAGEPSGPIESQQQAAVEQSFANDTYTGSSSFQTIPVAELSQQPATPAHRGWWRRDRLTGRPFYDALYGVRKGLAKNPELRKSQAKAIGMLGVGAGLADIVEGGPTLGNIGDDAGNFARGLNASGITAALFKDRAPEVSKKLDNFASVADLVQAVHDVRPSVFVHHAQATGKALQALADPTVKAGVKLETTVRAANGWANDISNMDTLFGAVSGVVSAMPTSALGQGLAHVTGSLAFQHAGAAIKKLLPAANWIIFADSTVDLVKAFSDPKASLSRKLGADAAWMINGVAVLGGMPAHVLQGVYNAYTGVKLAKAAIDLVTEEQKRHAPPPPLRPEQFFAAGPRKAPAPGRYSQTIQAAFS